MATACVRRTDGVASQTERPKSRRWLAMNKVEITDFLTPQDTSIEKRAMTKARLLAEMASQAAVRLGLSREDVTNAILHREELGSTGMGAGIAIPHARLAALHRPFGMLARLDEPIEYDAIDGEPVDIVFLLLAPAGPVGGDQINALACIARNLRDPAVMAELRRAGDTRALYRAAVSSEEPSPARPVASRPAQPRS